MLSRVHRDKERLLVVNEQDICKCGEWNVEREIKFLHDSTKITSRFNN